MIRPLAAALLTLWMATPCLPVQAASADAALLADAVSSEIPVSGADSSALRAPLERSLRAYESLRDYRAVFKKRERSGDSHELGPLEEIYLKFEKPFKIYLGWLNTHKKGLQVFYERGRFDGKLAIHKPGLLLGLAPVVFLEQDSPWVREGSASYNIEDAGIGTFLKDFTRAVLAAHREGKLRVRPRALEGPAAYAEEFEVTFEGTQKSDTYFAYRVIVGFDGGTALPTRMELFDWQDRPIGSYEYDELKLNVGPKDPEFKDRIDRRLFRVYHGDG